MEQFERRFSPSLNGTKIEAQGREVNATLLMRNHAPWLANIKYLYYNPVSQNARLVTNADIAVGFGEHD